MNDYKRRKILQSFLFALLLVAILLLASGLPNLFFKPGEPINLYAWLISQLASENLEQIPETSIEPAGPTFWSGLSEGMQDLIVIVFWLLLIFSIVYAIVSPQFRRELVRMFVFILFLMVLLPNIAKRLVQRPGSVEMEGLPGDLSFGDAAFPEPPPFIQHPPQWFLMLVELLLLVLFFGGIYLIWRRLHPRSDAQVVLVSSVKQALTDLESGSRLEDVVIACYAKMCRELQKNRRIWRHQAMTPREFENHLANAGIASTHIQQLTLLFENVRYGAKPTDSIIEHKAVQCLQAIVQTYGE